MIATEHMMNGKGTEWEGMENGWDESGAGAGGEATTREREKKERQNDRNGGRRKAGEIKTADESM